MREDRKLPLFILELSVWFYFTSSKYYFIHIKLITKRKPKEKHNNISIPILCRILKIEKKYIYIYLFILWQLCFIKGDLIISLFINHLGFATHFISTTLRILGGLNKVMHV